jgi:hypothetical protein
MKTVSEIAGMLARYTAQEYPLDAEVIEQLAECAEYVVIPKGETLCVENEMFDRVIWVVKGVWRVSRKMGKRDHTIAFGGEGDPFISLATYLKGEPSVFSFNPVEEGEAISIPQEDFKRLVATTDLVHWFSTVLCVQLHAFEDKCKWLGQEDAYSRYVNLLKHRPELVVIVPLKHIASYLGVAQATLSRIRARMSGRRKLRR